MSLRRDYFENLGSLQNDGRTPDPGEIVEHNGEPCVPLRCQACGRPAFYDIDGDGYHHARDAGVGCFLIAPEPGLPDDFRHPLLTATVADVLTEYDRLVRANRTDDYDSVVVVADCIDGLYGALGEVLDLAADFGLDGDEHGPALRLAFAEYQARLLAELGR